MEEKDKRDPGGVIWNDVMIGGTLALRTFNFYFILFLLSILFP